MKAFINGISVVSPQRTFNSERLLQEVVEYNDVQSIQCIDIPYHDFLDPMAARRMSRTVKIGVCAALQCLRNASIDSPDAIIVGTGLGCVEDTEKFLISIFTNEEKLLNPTSFIISTHNTVSSTIALKLKCYNYNNTYVHRGFSFESALIDGLMLLQEDSANNVLVGGIDEITSKSFIITRRLGFWKKQPIQNLRLLDYKNKGTLAGEGSAFFALCNRENGNTLAKINAVSTFYKPENPADVEKRLSGFIQETLGANVSPDLIIMGMNGDAHLDEVYHHLKNILFHRVPCTYYKHLCGEYDTSSSFALYLAAMIIKEQSVPTVLRLDNKPIGEIKNILVYNHLRNINHSMFLISSC